MSSGSVRLHANPRHKNTIRAPKQLHQRNIRGRQRSVQAFQPQASLRLFSPSKVNLFLRILRRREDGYHDLASLFHVIDFGDNLSFDLLSDRGSDQLSCSLPDLPTDGSNLVNKAFDLFRRHTGVQVRFRAHIDKEVPAGAGLGGGSGNAATALWAANELTGRPASNADLLAWSGEIGSDISIFFSQGSAYCTGRGEVVESVDPPLPLGTPMLLIKPPAGLSTPAIFKALDLSQASKVDPRQLLTSMCSSGMSQECCINDLERPAFITLPELLVLKNRLLNEGKGQFSSVFMSGSGSTIVCFGSSEAPAFLREEQYAHTLIRPAHLIARQPQGWYEPYSPDR